MLSITTDPIDMAIQKMMPKPLPPNMLNDMKKQFVESGMFQQVIQQMMQQQQAVLVNLKKISP